MQGADIPRHPTTSEYCHIQVRQIADGIAGAGTEILDHLTGEIHAQPVTSANLTGFPQREWRESQIETDAEKGPSKSWGNHADKAAVLECGDRLSCHFSLSHRTGGK